MKNIIKLHVYDTIGGYALTHMSVRRIEHRPKHSAGLPGYIAVQLEYGYLDEGSVRADDFGFVRASQVKLVDNGLKYFFVEASAYDEFITAGTTGTDFRISDVLTYFITEGIIDGELI